jgi:transcriptional regulator with XRE-family HTH domain
VAKHKYPNTFRAARNYIGLSQKEAARRAGLAQSIVSELETGANRNPTWNVLGRLCQLYSRRPEDLLGWPKMPNHVRSRTPRPFVSALEQVGA